MISDNESGSIYDLESYEVDQMRICSLYFVQITIWIKISFISDKKFETNQNQMKKKWFWTCFLFVQSLGRVKPTLLITRSTIHPWFPPWLFIEYLAALEIIAKRLS